MPTIKILPSDLINKIAAGEAVERPASVVKELVENSIDARAKHITIEIKKAGKNLIRVSDDGSGMGKDDLALSIERHATSKIKVLDDLFAISSQGFRGEALPSIAAVSKTSITSCLKTGEGHLLTCQGGETTGLIKTGCPPGTSVEVRELFYNTPARLKFLKSDSTEENQIIKLVSKYIAAFPAVSFKLTIDGKDILFSNGSGSLKDALFIVLGRDIASNLVAISGSGSGISVSGYISLPTLTRADREFQYIIVNKRVVQNFIISKAVENCFQNLIPGIRHPVFVVSLDVPAEIVDVNVHPTKKEVRFQDARKISEVIQNAVKDSLQKVLQPNEQFSCKDAPSGLPIYAEANLGFPEYIGHKPLLADAYEIEVTAVMPLIPLYQLAETYIIATDGKDLVIIDQHAAHERVIFDTLDKKDNPGLSQKMLVPQTFDLPKEESQRLSEWLEYFNKKGFEINEFGEKSFIIRAVPAMLAQSDPVSLIVEVIAELSELGNSIIVEQKQEAINKMIACKAAIKAGQAMNIEEINGLIKSLYLTANPLTCPHGRPTMVRITTEQLEKMVKR